jgi:Fe-S-cluster containining protein
VTLLHQIQDAVRLRAEEILSVHQPWPCRKGCDDCCRRLASVPRVTREEWRSIAAALDALPADIANLARQRIQTSASASRPVVCPLLDTASGTCLVYEERPVACRAYGFYAERQSVLGCSRIESIGDESPDVVWGNHAALENWLSSLGPAAEIFEWLASDEAAKDR